MNKTCTKTSNGVCVLCLKNSKLDQEKSGRSKVRNQGVSGREIHVIVEGLDLILSGLQVN